MALESVFANPPPLVGAGNKETLKHGEKQSSHNEGSDSDEAEEAPGLAGADTGEEGEIEEGEIIESGEEATKVADGAKKTGSVPKDLDGIDNECDNSKRKKRRKKRKKKPGQNEEDGTEHNDEKPKKPKRKRHLEDDRANDDDTWFRRSPAVRRDYESPERSPPGLYDSPYDSEDDYDERQESDEYYGEGRDGRRRKRSAVGGPSDRKRLRSSRLPPKGGRPRREIRRPVCKFYVEGKCAKGTNCNFSHECSVPKKKELCKFYLSSNCTKGNSCLFMHKEFPCKYFHSGAKCYSEEQCKFSHDPLTDTMKRVLERYTDSYRMDDLPPPPTKHPRPSLLGSPPRHIKEMAESMRKIPSLFDIKVGLPATGSQQLSGPGPHPPGGQPRPNFYADTQKKTTRPPLLPLPSGVRMPFDGSRPPFPPPEGVIRFQEDSSPSKDSDEGRPTTPVPTEYDDCFQDVDMRKRPEAEDTVVVASPSTEAEEDEDKNDEEAEKPEADKDNSSESDSESKKPAPFIPVPTHLPKKQRELFLRIQQQQREAESSQEDSDRNEAKKEEEEASKEENWYSTDDEDDDDGDQPLTDVLKKLQQQPPQTKTDKPTFDIAKMLGMIRKQASKKPEESSGRESHGDKDMRLETRDPRMRRFPRQEVSSSLESRLGQNKDGRNSQTDQSRDPRRTLNKDPRSDLSSREVVQESHLDSVRELPKLSDANRSNQPDSSRDRWGNGDKDMRFLGEYLQSSVDVDSSTTSFLSVPYKLHAMTVSQPNYNHLILSSQTDPILQQDPRLQKPISLPDLPLPLQPPVTNVSSSSGDNESGKNADPRVKRPNANMNGMNSPIHLGSPPSELPSVSSTTPTPRVDPRTSAPKPDPRLGRSDPRLNKSQPTTTPLPPPALQPSSPLPLPLPLLPSKLVVNPQMWSGQRMPFPPSVGRHMGLSITHPPPVLRMPQGPSMRPDNPVRGPEPQRTADPRVSRRSEVKANADTPKVESTTAVGSDGPVSASGGCVTESPPVPKGGSFKRRGSLDYASPLSGYGDADSSSTKSGYNRRPQQRIAQLNKSTPDRGVQLTDGQVPAVSSISNSSPVPSPPVQSNSPSTSTEEPPGQQVSESEAATDDPFGISNASLKDVFKTIDPTASPFC